MARRSVAKDSVVRHCVVNHVEKHCEARPRFGNKTMDESESTAKGC